MADFWSHSKVAALTSKEMPDALALWTLAHSWVDYQRTDGEVPEGIASRLTGWTVPRARRAAAALVRVGLWEVIPGGWTFHDWSDHNLTAEERDAMLGGLRAGGERGGRARSASAARDGGGRFVGKSSTDAEATTHDPLANGHARSGEPHQAQSGARSGLGMGMAMGMDSSNPWRVPTAEAPATNGPNPPNDQSISIGPSVELTEAGAREWLAWLWGKPPTDEQMAMIREVVERADFDRRAPDGGWTWIIKRGFQTWAGSPELRGAYRDPLTYMLELDRRWKQAVRRG